MGILEKIEDIEREVARTQKNKATEYHLGLLKAKLARYRAELLDIRAGAGGAKGEGFDVSRTGDARVALIGLPSVGKSTLLGRLTGTQSAVAAYEFTTLTAIPGVLQYRGASVQLLDLPGIIEGAAQGRGRGKQVIAVARTADLIVVVLDAAKGPEQRALLERELEAVGIRLNAVPPRVSYRVRPAGGLAMSSTCAQRHLGDARLVQQILAEYRVFHAEIVLRQPDVTVDELIDVVCGNRRYVRCLYLYNKIDAVPLSVVERIAREPHTAVVSCELDLNLDYAVARIWDALGLMHVYTKRRGVPPDLGPGDGIVLRRGATLAVLCRRIHRGLASIFKYALVWGVSAKHQPQKVGLSHVLSDGDVVQIVKKK